MRKKILSGVLVLAMMLTMIPTAFAAGGKFGVDIDTTDTNIQDTAGDTALSVTLDKTAKNGDTTTYNYVVKGNVYYKETVTDVFKGDTNESGFFVSLKLTVPTDWVTNNSSNNGMSVNHKIVVEQDTNKVTYNPTNGGFFWDHDDTDVTLLFKVDPADTNSQSASMTVQYTTEENEDGELDATEIYNFDLSKVTFMPQKTVATVTLEIGGTASTVSVSGGTAYYFLTDKDVDADLGKFTYANTLSDVKAMLGAGVKSYIATTADNGMYVYAVVVDETEHVLAYSDRTLVTGITNAKSNNITVVMDKNVTTSVAVWTRDSSNDANWASRVTGTVTANGGKQAVTYDASKSNMVKLVVTAESNCNTTSVTVKDAKGNTITVTEDSGNYIFVMPNADVTVTVTGEEKNDFSIKSGSEDVTVTVGKKTAEVTEATVVGTLTKGTNWILPLVLDMNTTGYTATNVSVKITIDGTGSTLQNSGQSNVGHGDVFTTSWQLLLSAPAKTVEIAVLNNSTVVHTFKLDLSGVDFAETKSANGVETDGVVSRTIDSTDVSSCLTGTALTINTALSTASGTAKSSEVTLKANAIDAIKGSTVENVTIKTDFGTVTLDSKTIAALDAANGDVTLVIAPSAGAEGLGGAKGGTVVEVAFKDANGEEIKIKDVKITLSVNFGISKSVLSAMGNVAVSYTDGKDSGVVTTITDKDIAADGTVTFTTAHLTLFYITTKTGSTNTPNTGIPTIPGNVPGSTIVTPGKTDDEVEDNTMSCDEAVAYVANMTDVAENNWFYNEVVWAVQNGVMLGTSKSTFAPNSNMTLYQTLTVLGRFDGETIDDETWMADAKAWALDNGILTKAEDESDISRERLVYLLYTYAEANGADVSAKGDLSKFADAADVSDWAVEAMTWAVGEGIINGMYGELKPADTTTRAQVVTVLMRYADVIAD